MDRLRKNIKIAAIVLGVIFFIIIAYMIYDVISMQNTLINSPYNHRMDDVRDETISGSIYDRNGRLLYSGDGTKKVDTETAIATCHLIGDEYGFCSAGAITQYASILLDYNTNIVEEIYNAFSDEKQMGNDITLTIDSNLNKYAKNQMGSFSGAVVIQNYETGEILAMVSLPDFDPAAINPAYPHGGAGNESLVNRCTYGQYSPGSLFYLVTLGAAIEYLDNYDEANYVCTGSCQIGDIVHQCDTPHGSMTIEEAFSNDCKTIMARVGVDIGGSNLSKYARQLLFNKNLDFKNIYMTKSVFNLGFNEDDDGVSNAAIGQHEDIVSPMHISMLFGAIGNDGYLIDPMLVKKIGQREININKYGMRIYSDETVDIFNNVLSHSSDTSQSETTATNGIDIIGKSATAIVHSEDKVLPNTWYAGYVDDTEHPLAISVIAENCYSEDITAEIAMDILNYAIALGY